MRGARSMEFAAGAIGLASADPARAAGLAARALEADAGNPAAVALHGHLDADLEGACDFYERVGEAPSSYPSLGAACVDLARGVLEFSFGEAGAVIHLTSPHVGTPLPESLALALARVHAASSLCIGDIPACDDGLAVLGRIAPGSPELAWFRFLRAVRSGGRHADLLREAVGAWPGVPAAILIPEASREPSANPGCLHEGAGAVRRARGAVLPVFAALPDAVSILIA